MTHDQPVRRYVSGSLRALGLLVLLTVVVTAGAPSVIRLHRGDTLSALARKHHTTVAVLQALNHMGGRTVIYDGQSFRVPSEGTTARRATPSTPRTTTVMRSYVVRQGDGLIRVARTLRTTPARLVAMNHLKRTTLFLGETLRYPVVVRTTAARHGSTVVVPGSVSRSAAAHRAMLKKRALPSKGAVQQMIRLSARRHHVPVSLALALAYQESGFQQRVVSPVDAIGAMQVLPSTGRSLGRLHGRTYDLLKASDNVEAGVTLIADLLRATGSVDTALAGYYQGLGSISRVGLLPQTKQYVRNIGLLRHRFA